eukprot:3183193-Rhodomonas_salina.1
MRDARRMLHRKLLPLLAPLRDATHELVLRTAEGLVSAPLLRVLCTPCFAYSSPPTRICTRPHVYVGSHSCLPITQHSHCPQHVYGLCHTRALSALRAGSTFFAYPGTDLAYPERRYPGTER